jgi:hypothetical protein
MKKIGLIKKGLVTTMRGSLFFAKNSAKMTKGLASAVPVAGDLIETSYRRVAFIYNTAIQLLLFKSVVFSIFTALALWSLVTGVNLFLVDFEIVTPERGGKYITRFNYFLFFSCIAFGFIRHFSSKKLEDEYAKKEIALQKEFTNVASRLKTEHEKIIKDMVNEHKKIIVAKEVELDNEKKEIDLAIKQLDRELDKRITKAKKDSLIEDSKLSTARHWFGKKTNKNDI